MNTIENIIPADIASALGATLMHAIWQLAAIAGILAIVLLLVSRDRSNTRYLLGLTGLAAMVIAPIVTFILSYSPAAPTAELAEISLVSGSFSFLGSAAAIGEPHFLDSIAGFFDQNAYLILTLWIVGALAFSLRLIGGLVQVRRLRSRDTLAVSSEIRSLASNLSAQMGIRRSIAILQSSRVTTPMVIGAFKPMILLPMGLLSGLSQQQVECILIHELAHVRRWDYLVNVLQSCAQIMLFFHPATWWISRLIREERENCCDQAVLLANQDQLTYARTLLQLEEIRSSRPALAMGADGGPLLRRIKRITGARPHKKRLYSRGIVLGVASVVLIAFFLFNSSENAMAASPQNDSLAENGCLNEGESDDKVCTEKKSRCSKSKRNSFNDYSKFAKLASLDEDLPVELALNLSGMADEFSSEIAEGLAGGLNTLFEGLADIPFMAQDSPVKKIVLDDAGKEVVVNFDKQGNPSKVTVDGEAANEEQMDRYHAMAQQYRGNFRGSNLPPMPAMPSLGALPAPPNGMPAGKMPPLPKMSIPSFDDEEFDEKMEEFGRKMEAWGEEFEAEMENGEWEKFGEKMEAWGEEFSAQFESEDWKEFEEEMEEWGERAAEQMESMDMEAFEQDMEAWGEQFGEKFGEEWGEKWEKFGEQWEDWGEKFGEQMEAWAEKNADKWEAMADEEERRAHELEREHERFAQDMPNGMEELREELYQDGLINDLRGSFKLKVNEDDLIINGKKQPDIIRRKYTGLVEQMMHIEIHEDWVQINHKKSKTSISN